MKNIFYIISITAASFMMWGCMNSVATNPVPGAFKYREIYLPTTNPNDLVELGLNTVDDDWGIWGHNLSNVLPEKPSLSVFARHDGTTDRHQFCFSSGKLFGYISEFIENNYGRNDSINFAILPNDNDIVCLCADCLKVGNTPEDASPAVLKLIKKLCDKYPNHTFFTTHYATTRSLPKERLPKNAGVLVSAIDYPLNSRPTGGEAQFQNLLKQWQGKAENVYVWDYINNFDDYFTPFPIFSVMQRRLRLYRDAGVDGVFLNGSGNDFSTFSHLHKVVLARMMINPDINWQEELRKEALSYYPQAGADIADYIIEQEAFADSIGKTLPLYDGVEAALKTHLQAESTRKLYSQVQGHLKKATGMERQRLEQLESALAYTLLELNRIEGNLEGSEDLLKKLEKFPLQQIEYYNEAYWPIANYVGNYEVMLNNYNDTKDTNLLRGVKVRALSPLDEEYNDVSILTDGLLGIPSNYHNGHMINSSEQSMIVEVPRRPGMKTVKVWMTYNPAYRIGLPAEVILRVGGREVTAVPRRPSRDTGHSQLEFNVPNVAGDIRLIFVKDPDVRSIALEEIQAFGDSDK